MAKVVGPWDVQYPVNFVSHGDTVRAAFGKHIQEIERIYGLLSGLGAAKIEAEDLAAAITAERTAREAADTTLQSNITAEATARANADTTLQNNLTAEATARKAADDAEATARGNGDTTLQNNLTTHINSTDPHPNLQLSTLSGNLGTDRIDGLENFVETHNVSEGSVNENGYVKFGNGLILQWGQQNIPFSQSSQDSVENIRIYDFPKTFPNKVFSINITPGGTVNGSSNPGTSYNHIGVWFVLLDYSKEKFKFIPQVTNDIESVANMATITLNWFAIGN